MDQIVCARALMICVRGGVIVERDDRIMACLSCVLVCSGKHSESNTVE